MFTNKTNKTNKQASKQTNKQTNKQTSKQTSKQTNKQESKPANKGRTDYFSQMPRSERFSNNRKTHTRPPSRSAVSFLRATSYVTGRLTCHPGRRDGLNCCGCRHVLTKQHLVRVPSQKRRPFVPRSLHVVVTLLFLLLSRSGNALMRRSNTARVLLVTGADAAASLSPAACGVNCDDQFCKLFQN